MKWLMKEKGGQFLYKYYQQREESKKENEACATLQIKLVSAHFNIKLAKKDILRCI